MPRSRGITLVELLVSVFILALALLPTFDLLTRGVSQVRVSREEIIATLAGSELLDQILCMPFPDLADTPKLEIPPSFSGNLVASQSSTALFLSPLPEAFRLTLAIKSCSDYLKKVSVTVAWKTEASHEVRFSSFMEYSP